MLADRSDCARNGYGKYGEEGRKMRHGITWMSAIVALCSFTASHAQDARESDPVVVTRSFLGAWAASSVDDLMGFMASDAVVVGSSGAKFTGDAVLRQVLGRLKGLQNRDYEVRLDGDRVMAHGKTYGYVPYVELGVGPANGTARPSSRMDASCITSGITRRNSTRSLSKLVSEDQII
jgi:ketosteroid isomerase-like protein